MERAKAPGLKQRWKHHLLRRDWWRITVYWHWYIFTWRLIRAPEFYGIDFGPISIAYWRDWP